MRFVRGVVLAAIGMLIVVHPVFAQEGGRQPNWQKLEADNGAVFHVDRNSVQQYGNGAAEIIVYAAEGADYNPQNLRRFWFDCQGKYRDLSGPNIGPTSFAPRRSIAGRISQIACAGARDIRREDASPPAEKPMPAKYCVGFSPAGCARIAAVIEAKRTPDYCRPGFALAGSGLTSEQLRICYVMTSDQFRADNKSPLRASIEKRGSRSYDMALSATGGEHPSIVGRTNLPDVAKLLVSITKPRLPNARELLAAGRPMCEDDCYPAAGPKGEVLGVAATVTSSGFSAGPYSWGGKPFRKGSYEVEIFLVSLPGEEPKSPQDYEKQIERMKTPLVKSAVYISP